ncbi:MAG TPA: PH domain-containing protein [Frankiaceae bacterium]|nr:PH domain-containing protein [Frankiaceae bacterium]
MANIARQLAPGEELVLDLHPHWRRLIVPFLAVPVVAALATFAVLAGPGRAPYRDGVLAVAVVLLLMLSGVPYLRWRTTRYLVTDRRVMSRSGIITRLGRDVPLYRLNDVHFENTLADRLTRSGDLVLESAGEQGQLRFVDVPRVEEVQRTIYRLMEADDRRRRGLADY